MRFYAHYSVFMHVLCGILWSFYVVFMQVCYAFCALLCGDLKGWLNCRYSHSPVWHCAVTLAAADGQTLFVPAHCSRVLSMIMVERHLMVGNNNLRWKVCTNFWSCGDGNPRENNRSVKFGSRWTKWAHIRRCWHLLVFTIRWHCGHMHFLSRNRSMLLTFNSLI